MYQIIVLNPGSTSTKVALYRDEAMAFSVTVDHAQEILNQFPGIPEQLPYRLQTIRDVLAGQNADLGATDAFAAICTGLLPTPAGVYEVDDYLYSQAALGPGSRHPGNLGPMLAGDLARACGARAFVVDPSSVDELCEEARLTGFREVLRTSRGHPLNQRAVAMRYAAETGRRYDELDLVVAHMGGGISVSAHQRGRMIETVDSTRGEGRMAPTRSGAVPVADVVEMCFSGRYTQAEMLARVMKCGGWTALLGTSDAREVERRIDSGDAMAELVYRTTAYQLAKDIGACAAALCGRVDALLLTGGLAHSKRFVDLIARRVGFIAPLRCYPGEFEMDALAGGALRVLRGEEQPVRYTGKPTFRGFLSEERA